ncbi:MAG TPA: AzlD domain-containing protein [Anaerolineae bacterium]|nr:AzlD domain-containing protein [Anaerolineae bacterium]
MTDLGLWLILIGMGVVTYTTRLLPIVLLERLALPPIVLRALRYVPPAVLSAIIFPELLIRDGALDVSLGNARLLAGALAGFVAWRTKNIILTIVSGMAALWILQAILSQSE